MRIILLTGLILLVVLIGSTPGTRADNASHVLSYNQCSSGQITTVTSLPCTISVTAGNTLLVSVYHSGTSSVNLGAGDSAGNSYVVVQGPAGGACYCHIETFKVTSLATTGIITVTATANANGYMNVFVEQVQGVGAVDVATGGGQNNSSGICPAVTTTNADDFIYAAIGGDNNSGPAASWSAASPFVMRQSALGGAMADNFVSGIQTGLTPGFTGMLGGAKYVCAVVALKAKNPGSPIHASSGGGVSTIKNQFQGYAPGTGIVGFPTIIQTQRLSANYPGINGDTNLCTGWSPSGSIICQYNDGNFPGNVANNNLVITKLNYDPMTPANTTYSIVNKMDGFGSRSGDSFYDNAHQWKSWSPFYIGNKLYLNVISQDDGPTYYLFQSGLIMSPNNGGLWCNKAHYTKGGLAGPNSCDATNGKANGDPPQDDAGMQWPAGSDGSTAQKMGKLVLVQVCQANTINCPAIPGIDNSYVYFIGGSNTGTYLHRVPKTADPMLAASWTHYNNGSWDADPQNSTNIPNAPATGIAWISDMKLFVGWSWDAGGTMPVWTSPDLVNWSPVNPITNTFNGAFAVPILAAKRYSNSNPPHVIIPVVTDDRATYSIVIQDVDLGPTTARTTVGDLRIFDPFSRLREVFRESSPQ